MLKKIDELSKSFGFEPRYAMIHDKRYKIEFTHGGDSFVCVPMIDSSGTVYRVEKNEFIIENGLSYPSLVKFLRSCLSNSYRVLFKKGLFDEIIAVFIDKKFYKRYECVIDGVKKERITESYLTYDCKNAKKYEYKKALEQLNSLGYNVEIVHKIRD